MKASSTVLLMLLIAPIAATTALVLYEPSRWGGSPSVGSILGMTLFGYVTVPLWPTFLTALLLTPLILRRLASLRAFSAMPAPLFCAVATLAGGCAGMAVLLPVLYDASEAIPNWLFAGAVSGGVTAVPIAFLYRRAPDSKHRNA